jgi:hypothetical protein
MCVSVALVIRHTNACAVVKCHLWPVWLCHIFLHYFIFDTIFGKKKVTEHKMCVLLFSTTFIWIFLILTRIQQDIIISVHTSVCKVPVILAKCQWNFNFPDGFSKKKTQIPNFKNIRPVGTELYHADWRTDRQTWPSFAILGTRLKIMKCAIADQHLLNKNRCIFANNSQMCSEG